MAKKRRVYQIGEKIQEVIATEIQQLADPRFYLVTITSVVVSDDLQYAKIYWVVSGGEERVAAVEAAFKGAAGLLRRVVGKALDIRFVPELRFFYDDTLDVSSDVDRLLKSIQS